MVPAVFIISAGIFILMSVARKLDIMQLGEVEAVRLGIEVKNVKMLVVLLTSCMVGVSVSLCGISQNYKWVC